jgi:hypothetical protein
LRVSFDRLTVSGVGFLGVFFGLQAVA